jgi:Tol biopolymer transport system component
MKKTRLTAVLVAVLLALAGEIWAAGLPCPLVFNNHDNVMLLEPGAAQARKLGLGRSPTLSPDGRQAVWIEYGEDAAKARLVLCDLATGSTSELARLGGLLRSPRFAPDGRTVAFVRLSDAAVQELWLARPGEAPTRLAQAGGHNGDDFFEPMWFPKDGTLGFHDMTNLYRLRVDGGLVQKMPLTVLAGGKEGMFTSADRFAVRPGGSVMVFSMPVPGTPLFQKKVPDLSSALFLFDPGTKRTSQLTPKTLTAFDPAWTPDGQAVIFTGYTDAQAGRGFPFRIWLVRPGDQPEEICRGEDAMPPVGTSF